MIVNCDFCEKELNKKPCEIRQTKHNFCSRQCAGRYRVAKAIDRFYENTKLGSNGCIEWTGAIDKHDYGVVMFDQKMIGAHRASYLISKGTISQGLLVLHTCDNRRCVNPSHLYLGTAKDNALDCVKKGRAFKGSYKKLLHLTNPA